MSRTPREAHAVAAAASDLLQFATLAAFLAGPVAYTADLPSWLFLFSPVLAIACSAMQARVVAGLLLRPPAQPADAEFCEPR